MSFESLTVLIGGIATLAIFSFLIKENPFFRFFEHLFIGIAAGFGIVLTIKEFFWPKIFIPMLGLDVVVFPDGTLSHERNSWYLIYLIPLLFGSLYYTLFTKRFSWMAKLVIGFTLGMSGGIAFKGFCNEILPQVVGSMKPLIVLSQTGIDWASSISNAVFVLTVLFVMSYFFFSFKRGTRLSGFSGQTGRWMMMVCFGAFFGSTVMARMALLVERLQFIYGDWLTAVKNLVMGI